MTRNNDSRDTQDRTNGPKERYREKRKSVKDSFQTVVQNIDPKDFDWHEWEDYEMFETFEPIRQRGKR